MTSPRLLLFWIALLLASGVSANAQTPTLTTGAATGMTDIAATFNGTINPNGGGFYPYFDYGPTTGYGSTAYPTLYYVTGSANMVLTANPTDLLPGTTYHFRLYAYDLNPGAYVYGTVLSQVRDGY